MARGSRAWGRVADAAQGWVRLLCVAAALGCGAVGYDHLWLESYPWWYCLLELATGSALLGAALRNGVPHPAESVVRRGLRWLAGLAALGAAALGTYYWTLPGREMSMLVAGSVAVLVFFLARWVPFADDDIRALTGDAAGAAPRGAGRRLWPVMLGVTGVCLGVAACYANVEHHYLAAFLLWLSSLAVFALGMSGVADAPAAAPESRWLGDGGPQLSRRDAAIALVLILILAMALRLPLLAEVPALIDSDEGRQGRYAEKMWRDGFPNAFDLGWNGFATLSFMGDYLGAQLLGHSNAHLRLAAAATGILSVIPVFYWVRRWWGNVIGLLAVFILSVNHEHVYWSRVAFNNIQAVLVASLLLATFARVLQTRRYVDWVWFGYAIGLGFHTYHAAKLFPALLGAAALLYAIGSPGFLRHYWRGALVGALAFVLCCGPLLATIYIRWADFYRDTSNRMDVANMMEAYHRGDLETVHHHLSSHVGGTLLSFVNIPWRLGLFDPFLCVPFLIGVGWMLWRWRDPRHVVVLGWTAGIAIIASMLTSYPPNKPRMVGLMPVACVIPAIVAGRIRAVALRYFPVRGDAILVPVIALWLGAAAYHNWWTEFVFRVRLNRGDIMTAICRIIDNTPLPAVLYTAGEARPTDPLTAMTDCMIPSNPDRVVVNLSDDPGIVPLPPQHRGDAVLMLSPLQRELAPLVSHYYPEARTETVYTNDGNENLYTFVLSPREIEQHRGLRVAYRSRTRTWSPKEGIEVSGPPEDADFPLVTTWRGQVYVEPPGAYRFRGLGAALRVDGTPTDGSDPIVLAAGWHTLEASATFLQPTDLAALEWLPVWDTAWTRIPRKFLDTHPETHGLLGRYFGRAIETEPPAALPDEPAYSRIEAAVDFDWFREGDSPPVPHFGEHPSTMEWVGSVDLPEGSDQTLRLDTTSATQVFLDGRLVLSASGGTDGPPPQATMQGLTGRVPIVVRTTRAANANPSFWRLRLLWRDAGGSWTAFVKYHPPGLDAAGHVEVETGG